jgi:uncharacterized protein YkwD
MNRLGQAVEPDSTVDSPTMKMLASIVLALVLFVSAAPAMPASADSFEDRVLDLANQERASRGLAPLALSAELQSAARGYAGAMASGGFFSHNGPDGSTPRSRIEAAGYHGWSFFAENIAAGQGSPEAVMASWMNSEGHRKNLLDPRAKEIGIGHVFAGGTRYGHFWVQNFGTRPGAPAAPLASKAIAPPANANGCDFKMGFAALRGMIPGVVGGCVENERHTPENGDALQQTSGGLLVWRKADNFTAFTDGSRTWVNGPYGLQTRANSERFSWEK